MHRRGGTAVTLGVITTLAVVLSARTASAVVFSLDDVTLPGDPVVVVNGVNDTDGNAGPPPATEGADKAIDNTTTKYLNFLDYGSGFIVTPSRGLSNVRGIRLYTANDAFERDPQSVILEGANSPTGPFTAIWGGPTPLPGSANPAFASRNPGGLPLDPNTQYVFDVTFQNPNNYTSYRVTFPTIRDPNQANAMQIGEVELLGTIIPEPATLGLVSIGALGLLRRRR
jgi:hypothetical protein